MKKLLNITLIVSLVSITYTQAQITSLKWSFKTDAPLLASPTYDNGLIYMGSEAGTFYALNASDGQIKWTFKTNDVIKGQALATHDVLFFESGNKFYALNKSTGKQLWKYDTQDTLYHFQIDIYDDQRSIATAFKNNIYVGTSGGLLLGFDRETGQVTLQLNTDNHAPVRSSPLIHNNILYFGDWNGVVYAYDLNTRQYLWKKNSYDLPKPYGTFGGIAAGFTIFDRYLYFGARNHMFNVLDIATGNKAWSYTSPEGGWMFGTPILYDSMIYVGGSDNHSMHAFTPVMGRLTWKYNAGQNIMAQPLVTDDYVIFTTGNLYKPKEPGALIRLERKTGKLVSKILLPQASISAPILIDNATVVTGCLDGNVYAIQLFNL